MLTTGAEADEVYILSELRKDFRAFLDAAIKAVGDVVLAKMVAGSCFNLTLVMEIALLVTSPLRWSYDMIIDRLLELVKALYMGWGQTKVVEDTNKVLRDRESRDVNNKRLNLVNYWSAMRGGKTIALHDRTEIKPTQTEQSDGHVPASMFSAKKHSIQLEKVEDITGSTTWRTYSAQS